MAEIPSDIASSAAQSGYLSREVAKERGAARAGQSYAADRQVRSIDEAGDVVDTADDDARVFSDAEGQGNQGRDRKEGDGADQESTSATQREGVIRDDDGTLHVDLEA
jgi:hypothetical protein